MRGYKLKSGSILCPRRAEDASGTLVGDGWTVVLPGEALHSQWLPFVEVAGPQEEELAALLQRAT